MARVFSKSYAKPLLLPQRRQAGSNAARAAPATPANVLFPSGSAGSLK